MILVIPSVEIKNGKCVKTISYGEEEKEFSPFEMVRLWRMENAKCVHITDVDGAINGKLCNLEIVSDIISKVDIPIEFSGGIRSFEEAKKVFDVGVNRIMINTMFFENSDEVKKILETFGSDKVALGLDVNSCFVSAKEKIKDDPFSVVLNACLMGFSRVAYKDIVSSSNNLSPNFERLKELAEKLNKNFSFKIKITSVGGVSSLNDLLELQKLEPFGIDSVIIGRVFYENRFSCQTLWRMCEKENYPYTAKI